MNRVEQVKQMRAAGKSIKVIAAVLEIPWTEAQTLVAALEGGELERAKADMLRRKPPKGMDRSEYERIVKANFGE